mmetsp:Transcript_5690/g.14788  ORF Transcript_5690/g.14788 Transcript_5690/m.14788 type:complete len:610 (-) Transcript_5690:29-1858(-)
MSETGGRRPASAASDAGSSMMAFRAASALVEEAQQLERSTTLPVASLGHVLIEHLVTLEEGTEEEEEDCERAQLRGAARARAAYVALAQRTSKRVLELMQTTRQHLRFWESALQAPRGHRRLLFLQTGKGQFVRHAVRWLKRLFRRKVEPLNPRLAIQQKVFALRELHEVLAVALGEVHSQADVVVRVNMEAEDAMGSVGASITRVRRVVVCLRRPPQLRGAPVPSEGLEGPDSLLMTNPSGRRDEEPLHKAVSLMALESAQARAESPRLVPFTAEQLWEELGGLQVDLACADREAMRQINQHRSPTARQATWLRRGAQNALLLAAAGEAVRHSPLAGSRDMERWGAQAAGSVQNFMWEHLVVPASQIRKELQRTFRSNKTEDLVALAESQAVLRRMLLDFDSRHYEQAGGPPKEATQASMERVLRRFELEARKPLRNLLAGDLSNLLMIQMQSIKVQVESALVQMDRVLQANQMNFAALAALPFFAAIGGALLLARGLAKWAGTSPAKLAANRRDMQGYMRMLLVEAERAIITCEDANARDAALQMGMQIFSINALYMAASEQRSSMMGREWYNLQSDILELAQPQKSTVRKLGILSRMSRSYSVFRD